LLCTYFYLNIEENLLKVGLSIIKVKVSGLI